MNSLKINNSFSLSIFFGVLIGAIIPMFPITIGNVGVILIGIMILAVVSFLSIKYQLYFLLFVLFLLFGLMNLPIKPFDLLFVITTVIFFLLKKNKLKYIQDMRIIHYALLAFISITLLSVLVSTNISLGISYFIHTIFMIVIFYFFAILIRSENEFKAIIWGYSLSALFSALVVIAELGGLVYAGTLFQGIRAQGFFIDPNDFSPFLTLAIIFLLEKAFQNHFWSFKYYFHLILSLVILLVLFASLSRAALLNMAVVLIIYLLFTLLKRKLYGQVLMYLTIILLSILIGFGLFGDYIFQQMALRFNSSASVLQSYDSDRFYFQYKGLLLGSSHILGIGPGQFELLNGYATHNLYVRVIAENGWLAFIIFMMINLYVLWMLFRFREKVIWNLPVYMFLAVFVGVLINSLFLDTLHWRYYWFILGINCLILNQTAKNNK